ncbi:MAG: hypothetical protein U1F10_05250 [Burkholderiales bacterium]
MGSAIVRAAARWWGARVQAQGIMSAVLLAAGLALAPGGAVAQSNPLADLVVNQNDVPDPGPAGGVFTYTVRVDNNGPDGATNVALADTIPPGSTFVNVTTTQGTCAAPVGGVVNCALGDIAFGANVTVDIKVILPTPGVWTNKVTATSDVTDPNPSNNVDDTESTTAQNASDMTLSVTDAPDPVSAGAAYAYTVTAINNGPIAAPSQTVTFAVPAGACVTALPTGGVTWSCSPSGIYPACSGQTITCTRATSLASGASAPAITVNAVANAGGSITGTFTVSSPLPDGNPNNNTVTATTTVNGGSTDLSIAKTASASSVAVGSNVTFTVTPSLRGGEPAGQGGGLITVVDNFPAGVTLTANPTGPGWTCSSVPAAPTPGPATITCTRPGPFASNFTAMPAIIMTGTVTGTGTFVNTASVSSPETDPVPANNTNSVTITGSNDADMSIAKTGASGPVFPGDPFNFTLTPRNNGPVALPVGKVVTVTDTIPAGISVRSAPTSSGNFWSCSVPGAPPYPIAGPVTVTCTRTLTAALGANSNMTAITIPVTTNSVGSFPNTACVALSGPGPVDNNPANDCNNPAVNTISTAVGQGADLRVVSKTAAPDPVRAGDILTYVITVTNAGPNPATNVTVTDPLPSLVASGGFVSAAPTQGTCSFAAGTLTCNLGTLNVGDSPFITVVVRPSVTVSGSRINTATVSSPDIADPTPGNNTGTATTQVTAVADVAVTKTAAPSPVQAGTDLTYTINARNNGPSTASAVTVTDTLPANAVFVSATATGGATCTSPAVGATGGTVTCSWTQITLNQQFQIIVKVRPLTGATSLQNDVTITTTTEDSNLANNAATVTTPVTTASIDLIVNKIDSVDPVALGSLTRYTITVSNGGPSYATNVVMSDDFPSGSPTATFSYQGNLTVEGGGVCVEPAIGTTSGNLSCTWAGMPSGAAYKLMYDMRAETIASGTSGTTFNKATVTATEPESQVANNTTTHSTTTRPAVDLAIIKTAPASVNAGAALAWTITVTNNGPADSHGAVVSDTLPTGVTFVSASPGCGFASGKVTCTLGLLAAGNSVPLTINVTVNDPYTGAKPLANTATVAAVNEVDTNPANNSSTATTTVVVQADVGVTKTVNTASPAIGANVVFTVTVTNNGPNVATGVVVQDKLPSGYSFVGASPSQGSYNPTSGAWTVGTLANGASVTLQLTATVLASGTTLNVATVQTTTPDPNPNNDSASVDTTPVAQADLAITKTVNNGAPNAGSNVVFTLSVHNNGPSAAQNVQVSDPLPAGYSFVSAAPQVGSYDPQTGLWSGIGTMANGATVQMTITVQVQGTGPWVNTATVSTTTVDPNSANNASTATTAPVAVASLAITKTDNSPTYTPGGTGTYVVVVTNGGPSPASSVTVTDPLPTGVTLNGTVTCAVAGTATCGNVTGVSGQTSFGTTGATIAAGAGNKLTFTVPVKYASSLLTDPLQNTATASDPASATVQASDSSSRAASVALVVKKTDGSATYTPGGTATYVVTVTNTGPTDAGTVVVTDTLPAGVTLTAAVTCAANGVATCGTVTGSSGETAFGTTGATLGAGPADSLVFTVPVAFAPGMTTNPLVNTAVATDTATNATASGSDSNALAAQVSLAVTKTDGSATYTPGGIATYTVTIVNGGLSTANNVTVTDPLPAGVTLTANATCSPAGASSCGTVTGNAGQGAFGATGAIIVPGATNALTFTAPVAFAAGMSANPLVNTATAVDVPTGATGEGQDSNARAAKVTLVVVKTDNATTYTPGGTGTYVVTVTNTGTSDALAVTVNDPLPPGVTLAGTAKCAASGIATCGAVTGSAGQSTFGVTGAGIGAGPGNALVLTAPVAFSPALVDDPLVNTATATDTASGATGSGSDSNGRAAAVSLAISKSDGSPTYTPGGTATYVIRVANTGASNAGDVTVSDTLPAGVTINGAVTCTAAAGSSCGSVTGAPGGTSAGVTGASLSAGSQGLTISVPVAFAAGMTTDPLVNTVYVNDHNSGASGSASDSNTRKPAGSAPTLGKTISPSTIVAGGTATLTLALGNGNPGPMTLTAAFTDTMPAGVTTTSGNTGTCTGVTVTPTQITMASGATIPPGGCTIVVTVTSTTPGTVVNTTSPLVTDQGTAPSASAPLTVTLVPPPPAIAELEIVKTANVANVAPGSVVTYTIVVTNHGPDAALGATVTDTLPATLSGVTWTCVASAGSSCPASGSGNLNVQVNLPPGGTVTFTVKGTLAAGATGTVVNTATVTPPAGVTDPNSGDNSSTVTLPVVPPAVDVHLAIAKTHNGPFTPGQVGATYTITLTNVGSHPTVGTVSVVDTVPTGIVATGIAGPGWTCTQPAGPCTRSDPLAPGASYPPLTLTVNVSPNPPTTVVNVVTFTGGGDTGGNNTATDTVNFPGGGTQPPHPPEPIPVDAPLALLLLAALLAIAGARDARRRR